MAVSLAPRVTAYGPYGASRVAAPYRPTAQGYALAKRAPGPTSPPGGGTGSPLNNYPGAFPGGAPAWNPYQSAGVAAPAPRGGGIDVGGGSFWPGMIGGDYEVQDAEAAMASRMGRARGDFQSQLRQMLVDLGVTDKSKLGNLGQYIDQDTIANAAANKYSTMATVAQQEQQANADNAAALAARGILTSGAFTNAAEQTTASAEKARYQGLRDFLSSGASGLTQIADLQDQLSQGVAQARYAAAQRAAEQYYWQQMLQQGQYGGGGWDQGAPGLAGPVSLGPQTVIPGVPAGLQPSEHGSAGYGNYPDYSAINRRYGIR